MCLHPALYRESHFLPVAPVRARDVQWVWVLTSAVFVIADPYPETLRCASGICQYMKGQQKSPNSSLTAKQMDEKGEKQYVQNIFSILLLSFPGY